MSDKPEFNTVFDPRHGEAAVVNQAPLVRRITATNSGPYTFTGTNTYLVGRENVCVIDPGPADPAHMDLIVSEAERYGVVSHILLTHTHLDHTESVPVLVKKTGAQTFAYGPHEVESAGGDMEFSPRVRLQDGDALGGDGWALTAIHTPGHCRTHLCFALEGTDILFSGDHVMGWSSSVIIPPDGELGAFFASLEKMKDIPQDLYLPGHGGETGGGKALAAALSRHRQMRNVQILDVLEQPQSLEAIVGSVYPGLASNLADAARATVTAHLLYLADQGRVSMLRNSAGIQVYSGI